MGVKGATPGDADGEGVDLSHSHLLTVADAPGEQALTLARLAAARALSREIARVRRSLSDLHRPYVWSVEPAPVAPFPLETLSLAAAGFHLLYREPGMSITFYEGTDDSDWLYRRLKGEFNIQSRD